MRTRFRSSGFLEQGKAAGRPGFRCRDSYCFMRQFRSSKRTGPHQGGFNGTEKCDSQTALDGKNRNFLHRKRCGENGNKQFPDVRRNRLVIIRAGRTNCGPRDINIHHDEKISVCDPGVNKRLQAKFPYCRVKNKAAAEWQHLLNINFPIVQY